MNTAAVLLFPSRPYRLVRPTILNAYDAEALAALAATASLAELVEAQVLVPASTVAECLQVTERRLAELVAVDELFGFEVGGELMLPFLFAHPDLSKPARRVGAALGDCSAGSKWMLFTQPRYSLDGQSPVQALAAGRVNEVLRAAAGHRAN